MLGPYLSQSLTVVVKVCSRVPGRKHEEDSDDEMADELLGHELFADYLSGASRAANSKSFTGIRVFIWLILHRS